MEYSPEGHPDIIIKAGFIFSPAWSLISRPFRPGVRVICRLASYRSSHCPDALVSVLLEPKSSRIFDRYPLSQRFARKLDPQNRPTRQHGYRTTVWNCRWQCCLRTCRPAPGTFARAPALVHCGSVAPVLAFYWLVRLHGLAGARVLCQHRS
jgi:hypothetical protein